MAKVLIIKLGYSETLHADMNKTPSLGDVLRTTVVLHLFKNDSVTWLVDEKAYPLLKGNKYITHILVYNPDSVLHIQRQNYDIVINLEKFSVAYALLDSIKARRYYGFRFDKVTASPHYYIGSGKAFKICNEVNLKRRNKKYWQKIIMEMAGGKWTGQEYILGYKPKTKVRYDIGLNWTVGAKWPNKAWPRECWDKLAQLIEGRYTYTWQKGLNSLYAYIDWINSCRLIVTADSLGQHIALALKRKVLILYGPTNSYDTYLYGLGKKLLPRVNYSCMPCLGNKCIQKKSCMYFITPERTVKQINNILEK